MNITLHAATEQVRELLDQIDPETGELPEGFEKAREVVATKATAVVAYMLESEKQADMVEAYAKELIARVKTTRQRSEWLKEYLRSHMAAAGVLEVKDERGLFKATLAPGRDEAIEIFDEAQLPQDYLTEVPASYKPDKTLIKKAIKDGFEVPGAKLVKRDRLTVK
jgi:hypothetical protein